MYDDAFLAWKGVNVCVSVRIQILPAADRDKAFYSWPLTEYLVTHLTHACSWLPPPISSFI